LLFGRALGRVAALLGTRRPATVIVIAAAVALLTTAGLTAAGRRSVAAASLAVALVVTLPALVVALPAVAAASRRTLLIRRRVAALPLVGVTAALVGVAALARVAALRRVTALFGIASTLVLVAALLGVPAALVLVAAGFRVATLVGLARRRVSARGRGWVAALLRRKSRARVGPALRILTGALVVLRTPVTLVVVLVAGTPLPLTAAVARVVTHWWYSWFCAERLI
jgi:hypothetical protein